MSTEATPSWPWDVLEPDPRARDFRRDFYNNSPKTHATDKEAGMSSAAGKRYASARLMAELYVELQEMEANIKIIFQDVGRALDLHRNLLQNIERVRAETLERKEDTKIQIPIVYAQPKGKKKLRELVCKRCDTHGHHWKNCHRASCSCGKWHSRSCPPLPTCVRGNQPFGDKVGSAKPVRGWKEAFALTMIGGDPASSSEEPDEAQ